MDNGKRKEIFIKLVLNYTLQELMSALKANCGSLFLFDSQNKELVLESFRNSEQIDIKGLKRRIGEGISGKVANALSPVLVKDLDSDLRFTRNGYKHYRSKSFISIPLFHSKGLLGLINLADKKSGSADAFEEEDLKLATTITKYACMTIDIFKERIEAEVEKEDIAKQKKVLEKYASVGKLASEVVHEISSPLDGIIRYTNILLGQSENNSIAREYLLEIKKGLDRITNTTRSLLEFSHYANSESLKIKEYVDIHALLNESIDVLSNKISAADIKINKTYGEAIPKILNLGLMHVLVNIIKNAVDAMPLGGTLEISTLMTDSMVKISFKDTGSGMSNEIKERIFEPFFTTKSLGKGTGLGLAICKEIVNKYEGNIEVQSYAENGTTFTILIPKKYLENA